MVDKEMLSAISDVLEEKLEEKLEPIHDRLDRLEADMKYVKEEQLENNVIPRLDRLESDMKCVRVVQLENNVIPRLDTIEAYYVDTSKRYMERTEQMDAMSSDISVLKSVVSNHSQRLNKIPV